MACCMTWSVGLQFGADKHEPDGRWQLAGPRMACMRPPGYGSVCIIMRVGPVEVVAVRRATWTRVVRAPCKVVAPSHQEGVSSTGTDEARPRHLGGGG